MDLKVSHLNKLLDKETKLAYENIVKQSDYGYIGLESLPNARPLFNIYSPEEFDGELVDEESSGESAFEVSGTGNKRNYYYVDFRAFLDNLFYGDLSEKGWRGWSKDTYYIHTYIIEVKDNSLILYTMYPEEQPFSGVEKEFNIECSRENSVLLSGENFDLLDENVDIFFEAKKDYGFFSYCLDDNCDTLGKSCILVKPVSYE